MLLQHLAYAITEHMIQILLKYAFHVILPVQYAQLVFQIPAQYVAHSITFYLLPPHAIALVQIFILTIKTALLANRAQNLARCV
jgi:hypothetical protein